jgi:hypothetical protein
MTFLWIIGHLYIPGTHFIGPTLFEKQFVYFPGLHRFAAVAASFFAYSVVAPHAGQFKTVIGITGETMQGLLPAVDASLLLTTAWIALFVLGLTRLYRSGDRFVYWLVCAGLSSHLLLHLIYGEETFLYSLHWVPLLIVAASYACRGRLRLLSLALVVLLTAGIGLSNERRLHEALGDLAVRDAIGVSGSAIPK